MSTTFESLTKGAKENYHKFFRLYNEGDYSNALVSARRFVEYIAKAGIYEICHNRYNDTLFQRLEDKGLILIQYNRKDYYTVKSEDIDNARTGKTANGYILKGNGLKLSQIDSKTITESFSFKFESSDLIKIFGAFIEQINQNAYYKFKTSNTLLTELFHKANPGAHSSSNPEQERAAYDVNLLLQPCTLTLLRFCEENDSIFLCDTAIFLQNLIGNTERTTSSSAKTPSNRPAQQNRSYNGYSKQPQNVTAADINKNKEAELRRQKEEAERARRQVEADLKRQQEETERAERARKQVEAELKRQQEETERAERAKRQREAELKRQQEETERAERARKQVEAELKRQQEEAERAKRQKEAELKRQQEEAERARRQREAELKRQQEQKKEKEIELIKRIIVCNDSIWRCENHCTLSDEAIRLFGEFTGIQEIKKTRLKASKELERLNPSFKIEYWDSVALRLICPNGVDLYDWKKYNTYSDFTEGFFRIFSNNRPATEEKKIARERNEILEKAAEIRNTFLGAVLNVAISIILILFFWDLIPTHSWIKYACLIATISIGAFVPFIIHLIFIGISNDSQFLTKPFISQAKESLKIRVRDDFKWTITEFGPSLVSVAIATLTLFLTNNAILSVLIGNFGIILTTQIICFKNFHDRKNMKQYYRGPFYYPQSTHWVSIFTNTIISFSIPAVIYLLFFV